MDWPLGGGGSLYSNRLIYSGVGTDFGGRFKDFLADEEDAEEEEDE